MRNNLWDWQLLEPSSGPGTKFFNFCDALEVKDGVSASESGWGADHAVSAWGSYFKNTYLPKRKRSLSEHFQRDTDCPLQSVAQWTQSTSFRQTVAAISED